MRNHPSCTSQILVLLLLASSCVHSSSASCSLRRSIIRASANQCVHHAMVSHLVQHLFTQTNRAPRLGLPPHWRLWNHSSHWPSSLAHPCTVRSLPLLLHLRPPHPHLLFTSRLPFTYASAFFLSFSLHLIPIFSLLERITVGSQNSE